jgi:hypothetical protein
LITVKSEQASHAPLAQDTQGGTHRMALAAQLLVGLIQKLAVRHARRQGGKDIDIAPLKPLKKTRAF